MTTFTVTRWERAKNGAVPKGLQADVLRALYTTALAVKNDPRRRKAVGSLLGLGVGAALFTLLARGSALLVEGTELFEAPTGATEDK